MALDTFHPQVKLALSAFHDLENEASIGRLITPQQWDRIIARVLGSLVNPIPEANGRSRVQFYWDDEYQRMTAERDDTRRLQTSLARAIGKTIHDMIGVRGQLLGSEVPHIDADVQSQPIEHVDALTADDLTTIRKKLVPILGKLAIPLANGDIAAEEIAINAMAVGTLSNRTRFKNAVSSVSPFQHDYDENRHTIDSVWERAALADATTLLPISINQPAALEYPKLKNLGRMF